MKKEKEITTVTEETDKKETAPKKKSRKKLIIIILSVILALGVIIGVLFATGVMTVTPKERLAVYHLMDDHSKGTFSVPLGKNELIIGKNNRVDWGRSQEEVKELMTATKKIDSPYDITYETDTFMGVEKKSYLHCYFSNKRLFQVSAHWTIRGKDDPLVKKLLNVLEKKYGESDYYTSDIFKTEYTWETEETTVYVSVQNTGITIYFTDIGSFTK